MKFDRRLLPWLRHSAPALWLAVGLGFAVGILTAAQAGWLSRAVNGAFLEGKGLPDLASLLAGLLGLALLRAGLAWGSEAAAGAAAAHIKQRLRGALFAHLLALGPAYTRGQRDEEETRSGELTNTASEAVEALDAYISQYLPQLALALLVPLALLAFIFPIDPLSGVVLLLTAPLIPIFMVLIGGAAEVATRRQWRSLSRMSAFFLDTLQGLTALKALGRSRLLWQRIAATSEDYRRLTLGVLRVTFLSALALELVSTLSVAVVAVEIGLRLLAGKLAFEQAFFVLILAPEFYLPLRLLGLRFHAGMAGAEASRRIFAILETPLPPQPSVAPAAAQPVSAPPALTFEELRFAYPDGRQALRGVSFSLPPGKVTALIGPNGSGKSTLAALLLRFITPQEGRITVDGAPLDTLPVDAWRAGVAWVPQNPYLLNDTVAANIALARPEASPEQVQQAARQAQADEFIRALPQGYETVIGERGLRLSGGQAQRIALARAFLQDASLLILDEPSASLDPVTEDALGEASARLFAGRTVLVIAHRLATVRRADQIVVLSEGVVQESGTHAALLKQGGLYRQMVRAGEPVSPAAFTLTPPVGKNHPPYAPAPQGAGKIRQNDVFAGAKRPQTHRFDDILFRLLGLLAPYGWQVALSVVLGFAALGSSLGLMATAAWLIAHAALQPSIAVLQVAIVGVRFFGLARGVFRYLERLASHNVTFHLLARWRTWFYQALEPLVPARLADFHSGDLLNRWVGDIAALENLYVRAVAPPLAALLVSAAAGLLMLAYHPWLAGSLLAALLLGGVGLPLLAYHLGRKPAQSASQARARLNVLLVDGIHGLPDLLASGQAPRYQSRLDEAGQALRRAQQRQAWLAGLQTALGGLTANLGVLAVLALAILLAADGRLPGVLVSMLTLAALASFEAVQPLPQAAQSLQTSLASARRLFEIVDAQPVIQPPAQPQPMPSGSDLDIRGLSFAYPGQTAPALQEVHLSLAPGQRLALVGLSGAGKSTLASLLLRFWDYGQGEVRLGGQEICGLPPEELRQRLAVLPQRPYLFHAPLRENLLIARPQASQAQVEQAARLACIHDFITGLPHGYDSWIGEEGLRLSAGERQRLALARALLQEAPLLILDEPTAHLDTLTEAAVVQNLLEASQGRALLLMTHRLVGMEQMDEILVLEAGRIVERGRHADLLAAGGLYRRMWDLQQGIF